MTRLPGTLLCVAVLASMLAGCGVLGGTSSPTTATVIVTVPDPGPASATGAAPASGTVGTDGSGSGEAGPSLAPAEGGAPTGPAPTAGGVATAIPQAPTGPVIDATAAQLTAWDSPSGNIVCAGFKSDGSSTFEVRCDVMEHTWKVPPKPASCEFDWGHGTYLNAKAGITCISDALIGTDAVASDGTWWNGKPGSQVIDLGEREAVALSYGASLKLGTIICTSQTDGMHCTNTQTKAGFDISRAAYTLR